MSFGKGLNCLLLTRGEVERKRGVCLLFCLWSAPSCTRHKLSLTVTDFFFFYKRISEKQIFHFAFSVIFIALLEVFTFEFNTDSKKFLFNCFFLLITKNFPLFSIMNSLPNDRNLEKTKLKALADYKIKVTEMFWFVFDRTENNVE